MRPTAALVAIAHVLPVLGQTWCNKNYMATQPVVPPGGQFPVTKTSSQPLLMFRCAPAIKPYLAEDSSGSIIIDTGITHTEVAGTSPFTSKSKANLAVTVSVNGKTLAQGSVPTNASAFELPFSLSSFKPQKEAFSVSCSAKTSDGQTFHATTDLQVLPNPTTGGVTKMDLRTGALLVKEQGTWETIFPLGFYTSFDGYIASNLSILNDLKDRGFTIVHPIPTFDNLTALGQVLDRMEELNLYLMYDMRFSYMNLTSVTEQVNMIKSRKNLLLWYTGDEPDGTSDPLNATKITYDLINELDGFHPVSLVLNCENYQFPAYTLGADVVMQDTYPVAINATFSVEWHAPCTPDFGDCGCDNCVGAFEDISTRLDEFKQRLDILGSARTKTVWGVPQAFGGSEYWARAPTGAEWLVESILSINHGAAGIVPWMDPNPADIKAAATQLAQALPTIKRFLFDPSATFRAVAAGRVDAGLWTVGSETLLLAANLNTASAQLSLAGVAPRDARATEVLAGGGALQSDAHGNTVLAMQAVGTVAYVLAV